MSAKKLVRMSVVASLYVVLTYSLPTLAYGPIQFRLSEVMTILAFIDPFYVLPLTLGCAIANIASPFGMIDVIIGSIASFLALYSMSKVKNIYLASIFPSIFSIIIGLEIFFLSSQPINFFLVTGQIMISEFVVVSIVGVGFYKIIEKNKYIVNMLKAVPKI